MKIMSDREYELRIREAEERGAQRASRECYEERERERMQESVWREMNQMRQGFRELVNSVNEKVDILAEEMGVEIVSRKDGKPDEALPCTTF